MKTTITNFIDRLPKTGIGLVTALSVVTIASVTALAYGPERPTYTIEKPASKVTFNSITNNPNYGDERNFTLIKDAANTNAGGWTDQVNITEDKEYLVRIYVHNNAASNYNLTANNTRIAVNVPSTTGTNQVIAANVMADNAEPQKVWDEVVMKSDKQFNIAYVAGSATYHNNVNPTTGFALPDSIVSPAGAQVGFDKMDGNVKGCFEYSGYAVFKIKAQTAKAPNFSVDKKVRIAGTTEWQKSITAKPGQKVEYQIAYQNTGETWQNNVVVKDAMPKGVKYDAGSTTLKNGSNPNGLKVESDNLVTDKGINIGNYANPANAGVRFTATLPANNDLEMCGANKLVNTGKVITENGNKESTAEVVVVKENCGTPECKPGIPQGDKRCADVATPVTELPHTGPAEIVGALVAILAMVGAFTYWYLSNKKLQHKIATSTADGHYLAEVEKHDDVKLLTAKTETDPKDDVVSEKVTVKKSDK